MARYIEVLVTIPFNEAQQLMIKESVHGVKIKWVAARRVEDIPEDVWAKTEVLYTDRVIPLPEQAPALRWVQFHFAGIDFAIKSPLIAKPNLQMTNLSGSASSQVAEYIVMALLALGHRLPDLGLAQSTCEWPKDRWERFAPQELRGSTVCLVGYGSIGRQVARLLQPFGVRVMAVKRDAMHPEDTGYTPVGMGDPGGDMFTRLYPVQALRSVLRESDFIVICVPLTSATQKLIGAEELAACKPGAYLINISRGEIVDESALIQALQEKKLAGAALDVFANEPLAEDNPLWRMQNVIITPHIAGNSRLYNERAAILFAENLKRYVSGQSLLNLVQPETGY